MTSSKTSSAQFSSLFIIEAVLFAAFWLLLIAGEISYFETIEFFEPGFTYALIAISICTGMLIGGSIERYNRSKENSP